jgi:hypothetical protein
MNERMLFVLLRGLEVWLVIICAEIVHGVARVMFLQPLTGDFRARQIGVFTGMLIIFLISLYFVRWIRAANGVQLLAVGWQWFSLTVVFELALGRLLNFSWERILSDYDASRGGLLGFGLLFLVFAPLLAAKSREKLASKRKFSSRSKPGL